MSSALVRTFSAACVVGGLATTAIAQAPASAVRRPGTPEATAATQQKRTVADENASAAAPVATNGTLVAKFTIKLGTPVPSGYQVVCGLTASVEDENKSTYTIDNNIYETANTKATVSGSTATCTVMIPYAWYLTNASTDTVALSYTLEMLATSATNTSGEVRTSSQYVPGAGAIKVPANNATTSYTIAATF